MEPKRPPNFFYLKIMEWQLVNRYDVVPAVSFNWYKRKESTWKEASYLLNSSR